MSLSSEANSEKQRMDQWCIHEAFSHRSTTCPAGTALTFQGQNLSYQELNNRANRLAHLLIEKGARPNAPVALYLDRGIEMVISILAVLKTGAAYVPLDLAYPRERLEFMLQDSQAPLLLTQSSLQGRLPSTCAHVICLDEAQQALSTYCLSDPGPRCSRRDVAYIIYTSGSTGKPKGVLVTHHNVMRLFTSTEHWYQFDSSDVWALFHSYAFDMSVWEIWGALLYGGRLVVVPYLTARSPTDFLQLLSMEKVTFLNQTPSAFRQLIWADAASDGAVPLDLRYVTCGGEALDLQSLRPWFERRGDRKPTVVNMYGITETTVHTTYRPIRWPDLQANLGSVIGIPIPDLTVHLLDEKHQPVPAGETGEICVGGEGVANGYLNRPELNEERFIPDPFSKKAGARLYRSGDLARTNAAGEMEYLGRRDHQVKIRGFRVELGEIESALNRHPGIKASVVLALDGSGTGDKRLVAYFVPTADPPRLSQLREHLQKLLPDYMVPSSFVGLAGFPLNNNGKIDRRALPEPDCSRPDLEQPYVAPRTETEELLSRIWCDVLQLKSVGIHDNFFELGGDSIRSISVISQAQTAKLHLTLSQLFQGPTVAELANCAKAGRQDIANGSAAFSLVPERDVELLPSGLEDAYPMTRLQLGMFFRNDLNPCSAIYHDIFSYRVDSQFDPGALRQSLAQVIARHPLLRTAFDIAGFSEPLQLVYKTGTLSLGIEDLQDLSQEAQQRALIGWVEAEKRRPFDRSTPTLVRWHVLLLSPSAFQIIMSFHHACLDGWSLAAVITEALTDYHSLLRKEPGTIAPPATAYRQFVALERQALSSQECRSFWLTKLQDAPVQSLPRSPKEQCVAAHEQSRGPEIFLKPGVLEGLRRLARRAAVPLKTVALACHLKVMRSLQEGNDVTTGLLTNGRPEEIDGEKVVGLFLNTLPIRVKLSGGTWYDLVKETFNAERELIPHRRFPLAEIQRMLGHPVFEAAFDFVHFHVYQGLETCKGLSLVEGHYFEANDLPLFTTFILDVDSTQLQFHIDYDPNLFSRRQIELLSSYYVRTLEAMVEGPDSRHETFTPLSAEEKDHLLRGLNATEEHYPKGATIQELVREQVLRNPAAVAVQSANSMLTYEKLERVSNSICNLLQQRGEPSLVGICMERTPLMVAALLGILKSGAAYVPLDPAFPASRLEFMLQDAQIPMLITDEASRAALPEGSAAQIVLDSQILEATVNGAELPRRGAAESLAYLIYTSGSTGVPKGVQITHRSVVNLLLSAAKKLEVSAADRMVAVTTLSFDIAGLELWMPLVTGGSVYLADRQTGADGTALGALLQQCDATLMQATPATWRLLLESGWPGKRDLRIICGGEALSRDLADQLLPLCRELWNFYGPTETTIWSTATRIRQEGSITIGRPLANTQVYILNSDLDPVPMGIAGELHIGGDGVALGYWNRPELTAKKFIANPFSSNGASPLYKTGDLARYLPNGEIEYLGRLDRQVKINGFRIELGEIEAVLRQHPMVQDVVLTTRKNSFGDLKLLACLTPGTQKPDTQSLREFLLARLPIYMVPSQLVILEKFPLTPNGKINFSQLPLLPGDSGPGNIYAAPRNQEELRLTQIWENILSVQRLGVEDNLFELGCDSLAATRAFARINYEFGSEITLRDIFDFPTVSRLAGRLKPCAVTSAAQKPILPRRRRTAAQLP